MIDRQLNLLILEERETDITLIEEKLKKAGFKFHSKIVSTKKDFVQQLDKSSLDIILVDYKVASMDSITALRLVKTKSTAPVIFISEAFPIEIAINSIKDGASDFILKNNIDSLPSAVFRAIRDSQEQREKILTKQALHESEKRFRVMADSAPVLIWMTDEKGEFIFYNDEYLKFTGRSFDEQINIGVFADLHKADKANCIKVFKEALEYKKEFSIECRLKNKKGEYRWLLNKGKPRYLSDGTFLGFIGSCTDVSALKNAVKVLEEQTDRLTKSNLELEKFAYITSHDLRAPIVNLKSLINLYDTNQPDNPDNTKIIHNLNKDIFRLDNTLTDLINILKLKKAEDLKIEKLYFDDVLKLVLESIRELIKEKNPVIDIDFSEQPSIYYDHNYLHSILVNLISNGIKFNRSNVQSKIKISTSLENDFVVLRIEDNGRGIDMNKLHDKLFGLYQRFHKGVTGRGLGLFLVKSQIESLDGEIKVESEVDRGTIFFCYLKDFKNYEKV